ncbi:MULTISPECIES: FMN-dependent NADH-azoreductase [Paraburkholderia]|uniref:FMN dependent NADH:quinone oxidoreductase n=1 Tax=Paraburkholderia dipogonis TaxID=1211383 RepID=A0A4Y8MH11_9BURK|nr:MULTISPECIES: FMN-dependent NADH-azoreductase [Paraburkholderia]RKR31332.1 FMN-dependent NADH-azoreductase [Paraburkholderia sp. BL17N1]TFE36698.1 FMN-dependent NADH-azoreductase [Paraburkholderia dipogonis]
MKILHLDSSILGDYSVSRGLSAAIVAKLLTLHPDAEVIRHDLVADPIGPLSGDHVAVIRTGTAPISPALGEDVSRGNAYIDELFSSDVIVIGAPMYNFSIAAQLKTWIDRIVVGGRTFRYTETGVQGLLPASKKVLIVSSRGGAYAGESPIAAYEHHESYLRTALGFIGLTDVTVIRAEGLSLGDEAKARAITEAKSQIAALSV